MLVFFLLLTYLINQILQLCRLIPHHVNFTHNAWISDDNNYLFTTDETSGCYIGSYDVSDIYNIQEIDLVREWTGEDGAYGQQEEVIPHNTHVFGDYLVTSYYTSGVTIIDARSIQPVEVAYYDTSPSSGGSFDGCWGAYLISHYLLNTSNRSTRRTLCSTHPIWLI